MGGREFGIRSLAFRMVTTNGDMPKILVIHCRHRGDLNNTLGIALAISRRTGLPIDVQKVALRSNVLIRPLSFVIGFASRHDWAARFVFRGFFRFSRKAQIPRNVAFVVSTLGAGEAPNLFISRVNKATGIQLGRPKRVPFNTLDIVVAHQGHVTASHEIELPISPSQILLSDYLRNEERNNVLLAIGGNTEEVSFPDEFWTELCTRAVEFAARKGGRLLVTTSPRTGKSVEQKIRHRLLELGLPSEQIDLYSSGKAQPITDLLKTTGTVIATYESVSMISEGIASGASAVAAYSGELAKSERITSFLQKQMEAKRVALWDVTAHSAPQIDSLVPLQTCWSDTLWAAIVETGLVPDQKL